LSRTSLKPGALVKPVLAVTAMDEDADVPWVRIFFLIGYPLRSTPKMHSGARAQVNL